ncbi:glycosyltransferase family 9 protein [Dictyobacter arantiisoli]|uniref:Glycosyl transferase n=1 Tax=Dictyobacter arantiisoli TaxID=2014874 RepID=A0A5A5T6K0_9CHLR|nr:glycosyltransferase family 9 protein [Dictyobacter arantiisoli]GCF07091.1 glycosyl transferase [Dictyobacter arantiisoli]
MKQEFRSAILSFVHLYGAAQAKRASQKQGQLSHAPRILLVRPDHLGDLILVTPILQALKEAMPEARITMMVGPWSSEIVTRHPAVDQVITCAFPGFQRAPQKALDPYKLLFKTARQLKQEQYDYDLALNLRPDFWWGAALLYLAAIPQRIGFATEFTTRFLTQALPTHPTEHATLSNLRLANAGIQAFGHPALPEPYTPARYPLYFKPLADEVAWITERLQEAGIADNAPLAVIHAGTGGAVKLWRTTGWSHIATVLGTDTLLPAAAHVVLTGSKSERAMLDEIAKQIEQPTLILSEMTVGQLAALLARADLVLGVDNGPLHIAAAQDTPSLRLFGPTDPKIFGPWGAPERHKVVASTHRCASCPMIPCGRLDFTPEELPEHPCVRLIEDQQVEQAIQTLVHVRPHH